MVPSGTFHVRLYEWVNSFSVQMCGNPGKGNLAGCCPQRRRHWHRVAAAKKCKACPLLSVIPNKKKKSQLCLISWLNWMPKKICLMKWKFWSKLHNAEKESIGRLLRSIQKGRMVCCNQNSPVQQYLILFGEIQMVQGAFRNYVNISFVFVEFLRSGIC